MDNLVNPLVSRLVGPLAGPLRGSFGSGAGSLTGNAFDKIIERLLAGRVDFVAIGDSNQLQSSNGWDHGIQYALTQTYPMYATGLISANENNSTGAGIGYKYKFNGSQPEFGSGSGAPAFLDDYLNKGSGDLFPHEYMYYTGGGTQLSGGLILESDCPLGIENRIRFEWHYGTFTSGSGEFRPQVRLDVPPYTWINASPTIYTNTGVESIQRVSVVKVANPAQLGPLAGRWQVTNTNLKGNFFGLWMRASADNTLTGFSYHTLDARGGQSARTMAIDLQQMSDTSLSYYFAEVRRLQGATKTVVITINSGLNDRNETLPSVGAGAIADGSSPEAYVDNIDAMRVRIEEIWTLNGWDKAELFYLFIPSHPVSTPDDADLVSYRQAAEVYASQDAQMQMININDLITSDEMLAAGYYKSGGADRSHLEQIGYEGIGVDIVNESGTA